MIPVVCFASLLFGNWPLEWNKKNQRFEISYYFIFTSICMIICSCYSFFTLVDNIIEDDSVISNPQYFIISMIYLNIAVMVLNRLVNARHSARFANELKRDNGLTVESGRHLLEFWLRTAGSAVMLCMVHYKYRKFTDMATTTIVMRTTIPTCCFVYASSTMEGQYTSACGALSQEFASVNIRAKGLSSDLQPDIRRNLRDQWAAAERLARLSDAHCRLARLVRLFNDEYGAPIFFTTASLLLCQIYAMNDIVSVVVVSDTFEAAYESYAYVLDAFTWTFAWIRLWWICYRADNLTRQVTKCLHMINKWFLNMIGPSIIDEIIVRCEGRLESKVHLTAKIMFENDINSYTENTRKMAIDFLDQLLHRHVRITAWGFYDVNKELLFMVLGYQFGLCLICTQFTTSGIQLVNNITTVPKNSSSSVDN